MFSFPLLTNAEILACLDELELGFTEAMLLNPEKHRDEVRNVFEQLAELCCGLSREDVARHARIDVDRLPYAQLHEESVVELAVFRGVADLLRRSGVADFGLRDWHAPSTKRLKKHLSGVINFAKFREDRLAEYVQLCQQRDAIIEDASNAQRDALEAQDEVSNVERETYDARQEVASAEDARAQFATDAEAFGRIVASASEKRDDLVDAARVLGEDITNSLEEVRLRDEECARLRDTAPIQTPEELESRIAAMQAELEAIDSAHADHSQELERAMSEARRCQEAAPLIQRCASSVEAVEADVAAHRARLAELRDVERQGDGARAEIRQLDDCLRVADGNADLARKRVDDCAEQARLRAGRDARALSVLRDELQRLEREAAPRLALRRHLEARAAEVQKNVVVEDVAEDAWIDACAADLAAALRATHACARELPPPPVLA